MPEKKMPAPVKAIDATRDEADEWLARQESLKAGPAPVSHRERKPQNA